MRWRSNLLTLFGPAIIKVALLLASIIVVGTIGYRVIESYPWIDALYMTVITISTVGFGEIHQLSSTGRIFTIILIFISLGVVTLGISIFSEELLKGKIMERLRENQIQKKIELLKDHVIVCGFGRNGRQACRKLIAHNIPFIVINLTEVDLKKHNGIDDILIIQGDGTRDDDLLKAGIKRAKAIITTLPTDSDNLFLVITAKQLNPNIKVISRASKSATIGKMKLAGADNVIMPDKLGGEHMASLVVNPDVVEFLDNLSLEGSYAINMLEINVEKELNKYINKKISDLKLRSKTGCNIIGLKDGKGHYQINPSLDTLLEPSMYLIVLGQPNQISQLKEALINNYQA